MMYSARRVPRGCLNVSCRFLSLAKYENNVSNGFELTDVKEIPDFDMRVYTLNHSATGAVHKHFERADDNCAFSVQFRTVPSDDTGVAHILEHLALCGSKNFPCPDPFFKMMTRSMATFMNAMTAPDFTMYPFSTQNKKDYENLLKIYLDAAFFPNLDYLYFLQEGWRYDHDESAATSTKQTAPIKFTGVVFNEMKGAMNQIQHRYDYVARKNLLPSDTYANNYGGDPLAIVNLTHEQLRSFHATHYHPSNARFITYGNFPLPRLSELLSELVLDKFDRIEPTAEVPRESKWPKARTVTELCALNESVADQLNDDISKGTASSGINQNTVSSSFVISDIRDHYTAFCWNLLSYLLTSGPSSPFHKSLIQSQLGSAYSPGIGFENSCRDCSFSIGVQMAHDDKIDEILAVIDSTLDSVIDQGFTQERIASILNLIELSLKHQEANFGINVVMMSSSLLNHDCDVGNHLAFSENLAKFLDDTKTNPRFLQDMVRDQLKNNTHRLNLILKPKSYFRKALEDDESVKLSERLESMDVSAKEKLVLESEALREQQSSPHDESCLPALHIDDIERSVKSYPCTFVDDKTYPETQICIQPTNGIAYFRGIFAIQNLTKAERDILPVFTSVLTQLGADDLLYTDIQDKIATSTGGLSCSINLSPNPETPGSFEQGLCISSHCLLPKLSDMFDLWRKIICAPHLDAKDYLKVLMKNRLQHLELGVEQSGHLYAKTLSESSIDWISNYAEQYTGLTHLIRMRNYCREEKIDEYMLLFASILKKCFNKDSARFAFNIPSGCEDVSVSELHSLLKDLSSSENKTLSSRNWEAPSGKVEAVQKIKVVFPSQVSYAALSVPSVAYTHKDYAALQILSKLLTWNHLHGQIREKGGAYGAGAVMSSGTFSFFSYRDPVPDNSLNVFNSSADWLKNTEITPQMIFGAKLSVFQTTDRPVSPSNRGLSNFSSGITNEMRQQYRDRLFAVTADDVNRVSEKYLRVSEEMMGGAVIGPKDKSNQNIAWPFNEALSKK